MAYRATLDYLTMFGRVFNGVLITDDAFKVTPSGNRWEEEVDHEGVVKRFENNNKTGSITIMIKIDASTATFNQKLQEALDSGEETTLTRDNSRNGGEKSTYSKVAVLGKGDNGKKEKAPTHYTWNLSYEKENTTY